MSVFVLISPLKEGGGVYSRCFLVLVLPYNSSFTTSYPFFIISLTLASFNFWKAEDTFEEGMLDLNFPNNVSAVSLVPVCLSASSPGKAFLHSSAPTPSLADVPADSDDSSFPIPKVSLT
jgi:hypothetical protein